MNLSLPKSNSQIERLFLGIPVYDLFKNEIDSFCQTHRQKHPEWKWVNLQNAHITLHFFGNFPAENKSLLIELFQKILKQASSFEISLSDVGSFKDPKNAFVKVVWLGVNPQFLKKLQQLQAQIIAGLNAFGFELDSSKYCPHVTLFRLNREMAEIFDPQSFHFPKTAVRTISEVVLYRSELTETGAVYFKDFIFPLN